MRVKKGVVMVGIIGFANFRYMQYLDKYVSVLDSNKIEYEVINWNRESNEEKGAYNCNIISFDYEMETMQPFYNKLSDF